MPVDDELANSLSSVNFVKPPKALKIASNNMSAILKSWLQQYKWFTTEAQLDKKPSVIQVVTFMSCIGADAAIIYNSFALSDAQCLDINFIQTKFDEYFSPKVSTTFERYTFNRLRQNEGESFDDFFTKIKNQAKKCLFEKLEESLLRDKIIVVIRSDNIREKLLSEDELNLEKAIKLCRASEMASQQLIKLHKTEDSKVDAIKNYTSHRKNTLYKNKYKFIRCGTEHEKYNCPAFKSRCRFCKRKGHFEEFCYKGKNKQNSRKEVDVLEKHSSENERNSISSECPIELFVLAIDKCETNKDEKNNWYEEITISGKIIKFKLDSAAQCNILPLNLLQESKRNKIQSTNNKLVSSKEVILKSVVRKEEHKIKCILVNNLPYCEPILGKNDCERLALIMRVHELNHYAPRRFAHEIRDEVKRTIDEMVQLGVLVKASEVTPTVFPMVVVKKKDCKKGFWQMEVTDSTSKYLTIATPWGRYSYKRLPFGQASAPEIYQA